MANPVSVDLTADVWNVAATNVTTGSLMKTVMLVGAKNLIWTYKLTGQAAPADSDNTNAAHMKDQQPFSFAAAVDIYVKPIGGDAKLSRWV